MSKKKIILIAIIAVVVSAIIFLLIKQSQPEVKSDTAKQMEAAASLMNEKGPLPGGNVINSEQVVVTPAGEPVKMNVMPNSPEAPTAVVVEQKKLTKEVVNIEVGDAQFKPSNFTVKAGAPVSLAFTSVDNKVHVITFSDSSLAALAFGVPENQTKAMTFNAPSEPGVYEFNCDVPGHRASGENGTMTVE